MEVGFLGTGRMGKVMAANLLKAGTRCVHGTSHPNHCRPCCGELGRGLHLPHRSEVYFRGNKAESDGGTHERSSTDSDLNGRNPATMRALVPYHLA